MLEINADLLRRPWTKLTNKTWRLAPWTGEHWKTHGRTNASNPFTVFVLANSWELSRQNSTSTDKNNSSDTSIRTTITRRLAISLFLVL